LSLEQARVLLREPLHISQLAPFRSNREGIHGNYGSSRHDIHGA
jgi:hypothetical protein